MRSASEVIYFIKDMIKKSGKNQKNILEQAGVSRNILDMAIIRDCYLKTETIISIANVLGITPDEILGFNNSIQKDSKNTNTKFLELYDENNSELNNDILKAGQLLKQISPVHRNMILTVIERFVKAELYDKKNV